MLSATPFRHLRPTKSFLLTLVLGLAAGVMTAWQSLTATPLVDYAYQVENAYRIFLGQMPYRDFFLVLTPGTYLLTAFVMKLYGGYSHIPLVFACMFVSFFTVITTFFVIKRFIKDPIIQGALLLPLLFTGHVIYPFPLYDIWCVAAIVFHIWLFLVITDRPRRWWWYVPLGVMATVPVFFKQNTGAAYLAGFFSVVGVWALRWRKRNDFVLFIVFFGGVVLTLAAFVGWLISQQAFMPFIRQTIEFPRVMKSPEIELKAIRGEYLRYFSLLRDGSLHFAAFLLGAVSLELVKKMAGSDAGPSATHKIRILSLGIFLAMMAVVIHYMYLLVIRAPEIHLYTIIVLYAFISVYIVTIIQMVFRFVTTRSAHMLGFLIPLPIVLAANATYLSHHVVGSAYGLWPLFVILTAIAVHDFRRIFPTTKTTVFVVLGSLFLCGILAMSLLRKDAQRYVSLDGARQTARDGKLRGLTVNGTWITEMEELFRYADATIPKNEPVAFLPGEDPFFAVTGRTNPLSFSQLQLGTYPVDYGAMAQIIADSGAEWVILKRKWQLLPYFGLVDLTPSWIGMERFFTISHEFPTYVIYHRNH